MAEVSWTSVALVVAGGLLSAGGYLLRQWRESRRAYCLALSSVLDIRHACQVVPVVLDWLATRGMPADMAPSLEPMLRAVVPSQERVAAQYVVAVERIAEVDPLYAFELRSKEQVADIGRLFKPVLDVTMSIGGWESLQYKLSQELSKVLDDVVLSLARHVGPLTYLRAWRHVRRPRKPVVDVEDLLKRLGLEMPPVAELQTATAPGGLAPPSAG